MDPFAGIPRTYREGRYTLTTVLGTGGAAEVWRARDAKTNTDVAVKILHPSQGKLEDHASRFIAEAKAMHALKHPRIVRVLDVGREDGWYWFAMELYPGGSLKDRMGNGALPAPDALTVAFHVLEALGAAHARGMVHRDVKPANVLFDRKGEAVLADFGVARLRPEEVPHRTQAGAFFGSFGYAAPEQRKDARTATGASDVYSVGATLYAAITNDNPADLSMLAFTDRILSGLPDAVRPVVARACAAAPQDRYADARAMAAAVVDARDVLVGGPSQTAKWLAEYDRALRGEQPRSGWFSWLFG